MSDNYFRTRLWWDCRKGAAKLHGARVPLTVAPDLGAGPVAELDYTPEMGCFQIRRDVWARWDEMKTDEIKAADALLNVITKGKGNDQVS